MVKLALKRADLCEMVLTDELLKESAFMKALGSRAEALLKVGVARRYPDRTVLFQPGDAGNALFFVLRGDVRLSGRKGSDLVELGLAQRGQVFGEAELLSGESVRSTAAVAQGDVDAAEFPREVLLERGVLPRELAALLRPIQEARLKSLSEMTDFMNRW